MLAQKQTLVEKHSTIVFIFLTDVLINAVLQLCNLQSLIVF